jgi:hypothetical protein
MRIDEVIAKGAPPRVAFGQTARAFEPRGREQAERILLRYRRA